MGCRSDRKCYAFPDVQTIGGVDHEPASVLPTNELPPDQLGNDLCASARDNVVRHLSSASYIAARLCRSVFAFNLRAGSGGSGRSARAARRVGSLCGQAKLCGAELVFLRRLQELLSLR